MCRKNYSWRVRDKAIISKHTQKRKKDEEFLYNIGLFGKNVFSCIESTLLCHNQRSFYKEKTHYAVPKSELKIRTPKIYKLLGDKPFHTETSLVFL